MLKFPRTLFLFRTCDGPAGGLHHGELRRTRSQNRHERSWQGRLALHLGELITQTNARGEASCMAYDKLGRLYQVIGANGYQKTLTYNTYGSSTQVVETISGNSYHPEQL